MGRQQPVVSRAADIHRRGQDIREVQVERVTMGLIRTAELAVVEREDQTGREGRADR